ncbi:MAG: DUF3987 domain-containing protein, partial [Nitrospinae bacterium]|nr:DUF3987 domain-containing protein [Nitrospinota bacterium]
MNNPNAFVKAGKLYPPEAKGNGAGKTSPEEQKGNDTQWPEPEKIEPGLSSIEAFPFEIMPEPLEAWVRDASYRMQSPPDFIAVGAINLIGAIIGTRCAVRPKQHDDWLVVPNLWGGVVGRPSTLKTPCLIEALKPLARLEIKEKEYFDEQFKSYEVDLIEHQSQKDSLKAEMKKAASGNGKKTMDAIKDELINLEEPDKPILKRYKTNDATIEKLSELLNENPAGLLLFRDELVGLLSSWDKPGRESDRAFFLESWNGVGSLTTDRIGRGTIFTKNLCLSVLGGIQPAKLTGYLLQSMNGLENDGLLQRLQLLVFPDEIYDWKLVDQAPDREARERSFRIIHRLTEMDFEEVGAIKDNDDDFPFMRFSEDAQQVFNDWITDLELNKLRADDHPMLIEHFGKYRSLMPTLALIIHLIDIADGAEAGPISVGAAEKAAAWCDYLESHARRAYGLVLDIDQQAAAQLANKIIAGRLVDGFTARYVYRKGWHLLNSTELAQSA